MTPEKLAQKFHETYDKLAPEFYGKDINSVTWENTSEKNRLLMAATFREIKKDLVSFDTAKKVLRIATKRTKLLKEILRSSKAFGYEVIVKKIEAEGLLLEEEDEEKELRNE